MEGVIVSVFSGAMNSLLTKLATLLEKNYKLIKSVREDITSLRDEMSSMNALLVKLSKMEELDEQQKEWRDKVRELAYDMEDCVDIFMNDLDHGGAKAWFAWRRLTRSLKTRYKIANRIKDLKARAVEVKERHDRYKFDERIVPPRAVAIDPRVRALHVEAASLVGVDGPKEDLIKLLTKEEGIQRLQVISIVGFGGIGKTTLANQVYTTIKRQRQYDCTAFVSVSRNPDMVKILSDILSGVRRWVNPYQNDVGQLIDDLKEHLKDKRYLIVIDDLWTEKDWSIIKCCFFENNRGGRVITTTRYENVAKACCSCFHGHVYQMKPLSDHDSRRLFHRRVFDSEDACPEQLNKVSNEIVQKCGGVPLAILCVASILSSEEVKSKESWEIIQNCLGSQLESHPRSTLESEWMRHVLNLSYNDLSQDLKTCMLYLGIFPEDYEIMKDDLMRRWIAEGFVSEKYRCVEEAAESNYNKLINRNIIQIARFDDCGEVMSCRVHDLMFDFIKSKSTEEKFMSVINDQYSSKGSLEVRRLSLQVRNSELNQMLANMVLTQARSFNFWGSAQGVPSLSKFRLLRVLYLDVYDSMDEQYDLSYIRRLFQLRYLRIGGIRSNKITQLRKLQHLKTLEIVGNLQLGYLRLDLRELPSTLLHLIVTATVELLGGIGRMRALRTLQVRLKDAENIKGLGELSNLRELKLDTFLYGAEAEEAYILLSSLCKLGICNLRSLTIDGFLSSDALSCWSPPPRNLVRLHVLRCPFSIVPDWITQLDKLSSLEVEILSLPRDGTEVLARLPSLLHLRLHVENVPDEGVVIRGTAFRYLREFWFKCKVPCLTFEAGAMPGLQSLSLEIECNADGARQDDGVLTGIEHLGSLKVFKAHIHEPPRFGLVEELPTVLFTSLEAAFRKAINKHPGSPDVSIIIGY